MAYYNKIGLLILSPDKKRLLLCKVKGHDQKLYLIMPGGTLHEETEEENIQRQAKEELQCSVDLKSLKYINTYTDDAAGWEDRDVEIKLYECTLIGEPKPDTEILELVWMAPSEVLQDSSVSQIIRNKILPDLLEKQIML